MIMIVNCLTLYLPTESYCKPEYNCNFSAFLKGAVAYKQVFVVPLLSLNQIS